jgi:4-carboxymuconolactone decarboxylase
MTRIAPLNPEKLNDRQREVYDAIASSPRGVVRGPLAVWVNRPDLADLAQSLGRYCRYDTLLSPRLSELAILITARVWGAEFEWQAHKAIALKAGVSPQIVESIRKGETPVFDKKDEEVVYNFALAAQRDRRVSQPLYDEAVALLGEDRVVDLTGFLGYYGLISLTINVFEVDPIDPDNIELS